MIPNRIWSVVLGLSLLLSSSPFAADLPAADKVIQPVEPVVASWTFSGMVNNESGDRYGYFFQMKKEGEDYHVKTALIDGQNNQMLVFYEGEEKIQQTTPLDWHVGTSFIRYNPINDSWIFGVKAENKKGFNFKVDMLKRDNITNETLVLRPGVELQALQTSSLNGHIQIGDDAKEQFVTGNNAWFGKIWFSKQQDSAHDISTTFCRLSNDNGFYSANLKEADATGAAIAGWRDALGNKVKMSQFISIKPLADDQCMLSVGLPKLTLKLFNTLKKENKLPLSIAGFSKDNPKGFCFVTQQSFVQPKIA